jgi:hypothetical protein
MAGAQPAVEGLQPRLRLGWARQEVWCPAAGKQIREAVRARLQRVRKGSASDRRFARAPDLYGYLSHIYNKLC